MRQFVGFLIEIIVVFIGHLIFLILIRPTAENKLFPFHVKTTQICSNPEGNYPHHVENDGGNKQLGDAKENITTLFTLANPSSKYEYKENVEVFKKNFKNYFLIICSFLGISN